MVIFETKVRDIGGKAWIIIPEKILKKERMKAGDTVRIAVYGKVGRKNSSFREGFEMFKGLDLKAFKKQHEEDTRGHWQ